MKKLIRILKSAIRTIQRKSSYEHLVESGASKKRSNDPKAKNPFVEKEKDIQNLKNYLEKYEEAIKVRKKDKPLIFNYHNIIGAYRRGWDDAIEYINKKG